MRGIRLKSRLFSIIWNILTKIPRFKETMYKFYSWRIFEIVPRLKDIIYRFYDKFWYLELSINNVTEDLSKYQRKKLVIDLHRINSFHYQSSYNKYNNYLDQDDTWDLATKLEQINKSKEFRFIQEHFSNKKEWREIPSYSFFIKEIAQNNHKFGCTNERELLELLSSLDELYKKLLVGEIENSIKVGISRNGDFVLFEGILQLSVLKILEVKSIPVEIVIRHPLWIDFYNEFLKFQLIHGEIYQPLIHPDLNFRSIYSDERYDIIKDSIQIKNGTLLDIGANIGYFCHKFEELGFNCYAVEIRTSNVYFMKKLRDIEGKKFKIINKSIFDLTEKLDFDIILALNIFHHFLREKELYLKLVTFLKSLKIKEMYFEPHDPDEDIMKNAYINYDNQQFIDFILKNSCLNNYELIIEKIDGRKRPIYRLYSN